MQLNVKADKPPLKVNASAGTAKNLPADKLDGKEPSELPGVVVSTERFAGPVSSIPGNTESWVFAGPTAPVTTTSTQRLVGAA